MAYPMPYYVKSAIEMITSPNQNKYPGSTIKTVQFMDAL